MKIGSKVICIEKNIGRKINSKNNSEIIEGETYEVLSDPIPFMTNQGLLMFIQVSKTSKETYWLVESFREIEERTFTNKLTAKLAYQATEERIEYSPFEIRVPERRKIEIE